MRAKSRAQPQAAYPIRSTQRVRLLASVAPDPFTIAPIPFCLSIERVSILLHTSAVAASTAPSVVVGERCRAERDTPQGPHQPRGHRCPAVRGEALGEEVANDLHAGRGHHDGDQRGGDDRHRRRDPSAGEPHHPAREDLSPTLHEPQGQDRPHDVHSREACPRPPQADLLAFAQKFLGDAERYAQRPRPANCGVREGYDDRDVSSPPPPPCRCGRRGPPTASIAPSAVGAGTTCPSPVGHGGPGPQEATSYTDELVDHRPRPGDLEVVRWRPTEGGTDEEDRRVRHGY